MKRNTTSAGDGFLYQLGQSIRRLLITKLYMQVIELHNGCNRHPIPNLDKFVGHKRSPLVEPRIPLAAHDREFRTKYYWLRRTLTFERRRPSRRNQSCVARFASETCRTEKHDTNQYSLWLRYKTDKKLHLTDVTFSRWSRDTLWYFLTMLIAPESSITSQFSLWSESFTYKTTEKH